MVMKSMILGCNEIFKICRGIVDNFCDVWVADTDRIQAYEDIARDQVEMLTGKYVSNIKKYRSDFLRLFTKCVSAKHNKESAVGLYVDLGQPDIGNNNSLNALIVVFCMLITLILIVHFRLRKKYVVDAEKERLRIIQEVKLAAKEKKKPKRNDTKLIVLEKIVIGNNNGCNSLPIDSKHSYH